MTRIRRKVQVTDDGCWIWPGKGRYATLHWDCKTYDAHRFVYEKLTFAGIPAGAVLDHRCRRTRCVNPAHLEPVTQAENVRRGLLGELRATTEQYAEVV